MTEPPIAALLRHAGYHLPAETLAGLAYPHALLVAMLARLHGIAPEAEPATIFRPDAPR